MTENDWIFKVHERIFCIKSRLKHEFVNQTIYYGKKGLGVAIQWMTLMQFIQIYGLSAFEGSKTSRTNKKINKNDN